MIPLAYIRRYIYDNKHLKRNYFYPIFCNPQGIKNTVLKIQINAKTQKACKFIFYFLKRGEFSSTRARPDRPHRASLLTNSGTWRTLRLRSRQTSRINK